MGVNSISNEKSTTYLIDDDNISHYYEDQENGSDDENIRNNEEKNNEAMKIPIAFEWDNGGSNVYVTGSFCNWKQFFLMKKSEDGKFILNLNLPRGNYQYKFKVDNEWKYNEKYPICNENGIINNCIDTTNWEIIEERTTEANTSNTTDNEKSKSKKSLSKIKNLSYLKKKYTNYIPNDDELKDTKETIPEVPIQYRSYNNINLFSKQNTIGNDKYYKVHELNILSDNLSFKNIGMINHEQINHLNINKEYIINRKNNLHGNAIYSISTKYRHKCTTFVYYKNHDK
jgi:hypothetical protein